MADRQLLHDGTTKRVFAALEETKAILEFKDSATEFDGEKKAKFKNKGELRSTMTSAIFEYLEGYNIPTHFEAKTGDRELRVRRLDMIPVQVHVRNVAAGSLCERFKVQEGMVLNYPILEYYLKNEELGYPLILESHAYAFEYATPDEMKHIARLASKVNAVLKSYFERRQLKLIDYQLEFGRGNGQIYLGDEITPDTLRLWEIVDEETFNKKLFSFENSHAENAYKEILERLLGK